MLIDLRKIPDDAPQSAETLIVGSGAVGLSMAVELARAGRQVTVLEAGGRSVDAESQEFFKNAACRDLNLTGLHLGRFRLLGGTTNFWGGQLLPFDPIVFEPRPWVADQGWPVTRRDLDAHYERAFALLGIHQRLDDARIWDRLNLVTPRADDLDIFFSAWAPKPNLADLFGSEIDSGTGLRVFLNAPAVALELDDAGERVTGVLVRTIGGKTYRFLGQRVILANGTIEIARLMKLALGDGRPAPWASNPWLGNGFVDHIDCFAGHVTPLDRGRFHDLFDNAFLDGIKYAPKLKPTERAQRERKLLGVSAHFLFNSNLGEHLENAKLLVRSLLRGQFRWQLIPNLRSVASVLRVALPMVVRYARYRRMYNPADQGIKLRVCCEQVPLLQSAIHLGRTRDRLGMPIVEMDWRIDGREIETLATFSGMVADYLERNGLASVRLDPALMGRDPGFLKQIDDGYHQMGMARMAETQSQGVVDRDLRVFGTKNLYVAGAAVYPTTGCANPTLTAIALGLRLADAICAGRLT